ncbi:MAG: ferrochelatase, partial [Opitutaceae bacterium]|nr:ferrochelatase [Opitutaceae bacterium]
MPKRAVLLVNLGSPDSPAVPDVRRYLGEFLGDPRVIDKPGSRLLRSFLVNQIIIRKRAEKAARAYASIWTPEGSPLIATSRSVRDKLAARLASGGRGGDGECRMKNAEWRMRNAECGMRNEECGSGRSEGPDMQDDRCGPTGAKRETQDAAATAAASASASAPVPVAATAAASAPAPASASATSAPASAPASASASAHSSFFIPHSTLGGEAAVYLAMRYGRPSIASVIAQLAADGVERALLFPQYPHYAMSSWETVVVEAFAQAARLAPGLRMDCVQPFHADADYIDALAASARPALAQPHDHLLFSYHGIPERHLRKADS